MTIANVKTIYMDIAKGCYKLAIGWSEPQK
jgi:hypothetical protein